MDYSQIKVGTAIGTKVKISINSVSTSSKYYPSISVNIINNTNDIIKVRFIKAYFVNYVKMQLDLSYDRLNGNNLEILPNVGRLVSFTFDNNFNIRNFYFNPNDLLILTFEVNGETESLGVKIGEVSGVLTDNNFKDFNPNDPAVNKDNLKYFKESNYKTFWLIFSTIMIFIPFIGLLFLLVIIIVHLSKSTSKWYTYKTEAVYRSDLRYKTGKRFMGNIEVKQTHNFPLTMKDKKDNKIIFLYASIASFLNLIFMSIIMLK